MHAAHVIKQKTVFKPQTQAALNTCMGIKDGMGNKVLSSALHSWQYTVTKHQHTRTQTHTLALTHILGYSK